MRFLKTKELYHLLQTNQVFDDFEKVKEITKGGSSFNFYVKAKGKEYLLKLISFNIAENYYRLKEILQSMELLQPIKMSIFDRYYLLAQPFFKGKKIVYSDCTSEVIAELLKKYDGLRKFKISSEIVLNQQEMEKISSKISVFLSKSNSFMDKLLRCLFWNRIQNELIQQPKTNEIIHGDFTSNNVLVDKSKNVYLLDYESIRYGYEIEDICCLFLQISGFRGMFGSLTKFKKLQNRLSEYKTYSKEMWLYGIQLFYINTISRRLFNNSKRRKIRKDFCLIISVINYFRLSKYLQEN